MGERYLFEELRAAAAERVGRLLAADRLGPAAPDLEQLQARVLDELHGLSANFKYVVSAALLERRRARVWQSVAAHWNNETDGALLFEAPVGGAVLLLNVFVLSP